MFGIRNFEEFEKSTQEIAHELHFLNDVMALKQGMRVKPNLMIMKKDDLKKHHIEMGKFLMRMAGVEPNF